MSTIASAAFALALAVFTFALTSVPVSALETQVVTKTLPLNGMKVVSRCTIWVGKCLHWWGPRSPMYGKCLRNHGC
jgi:hypothetical protein